MRRLGPFFQPHSPCIMALWHFLHGKLKLTSRATHLKRSTPQLVYILSALHSAVWEQQGMHLKHHFLCYCP